MDTEPLDIELNYLPRLGSKTDYGIGAIGAGFIMRDVQLAAYNEAGFRTVAIASRTPASAHAAAEQNGVDRVHDTWHELLDNPEVVIVDIAFPPDAQLEIVRAACERDHVKGILAQKPLASTLADAQRDGAPLRRRREGPRGQPEHALRPVDPGAEDPARRWPHGRPVVAQIVMNARPHWQEFIRGYGRIAILNMSIHHLDVFRYLFGDPERILASVRNDPSMGFPPR